MAYRTFSGRPVYASLLAGLLGTALLSACGSVSTGNAGSGTLGSSSSTTTTSKTDVMTFQPTSLPVAYIGETYNKTVAVTGGVGPYGYRVTRGTLPPGLKFLRGSISGTPTTAGTYVFSVEATDANLSTRVQEYTVNVDKLPPLSLEPTLPPSEIRGETRIPLTIKAPRQVRAARLSWDLGPDVKVTRVQAAEAGNIVFWKQQGSVLTMDVGFRNVPRPDSRVAMITVKPSKAVRISAAKLGYLARDGKGEMLVDKALPAPPKPAVTKPQVPATLPEKGSAVPASAETTPAQPKPADVEKSDLTAPATPTPTAPAATGPAAPNLAPADPVTTDPATKDPAPTDPKVPVAPEPEVPQPTPPSNGGGGQ